MDPPAPHPAQPDDRHDRGCASKRLPHWRFHDRGQRHPCRWPARRLDHLQRSRQRRRAAGHRPGRLRVSAAARPGPGGSPKWDNCLASHGIRVVASYQPVSRYWPLQLTETGLFLALALALTGLCFWRLGRCRS